MPTTMRSLAWALLIALSPAAIAGPAHVVAQSAQTNTSQSNSEVNTYNVELKLDSALQQGSVDQGQHQAIRQQQASFISAIQNQFGKVKVLGQSLLFSNQLSVELFAHQAEQLKSFPQVKRVTLAGTADNSIVMAPQNPQQILQKFAVEPPLPLAGADGGKGVTVAILSTGVDYTHKWLGGSGTEDAYQKAMRHAGAPYEGFPTSVVTSGRDFISDHPDMSLGYDENPIEPDLTYEIPGEGRYPTGRGTMLASYLHQLAPGAEIRAVKMYGITAENGDINFIAGPNPVILSRALEWAVDPNGDGDLSDKADIILLDFQYYGHGIYSQKDNAGDVHSLYVAPIQRAASTGALVLVPQGDFRSDNRFATPYQATVPAALAVGSSYQDQDMLKVNSDSPHGPVRSELELLKPDLVSLATDIVGAAVGGGEATSTDSGSIYATARVAAMAAVLKGLHPKLNAVELKSLINTTADTNVKTPDGSQQAEVTWIGHGNADVAAALKSPLLAWDSSTYLSSINFGLQEVQAHQNTTLTRHLYLRNLSNKEVVYKIEVQANQPERHKALSWQHPATVTLAPGRSALIPVTLSIQSNQLADWPLLTSDDYSAEKWRETELDGYIALSSEGLPTNHLAWLVRARAKADIQKIFASKKEYLALDGYRLPIAEQYLNDYLAMSQDFKNISNKAMTYAVYPTIRQRLHKPLALENSQGIVLKAVGSGVYPEAQCSSGQKLSLAATLFESKELATATYAERGDAFVAWEIVNKEFTEAHATEDANNVLNLIEDKDIILRAYTSIDFVTGQPIAYYADVSLPLDFNDPRARYRKSKLPARFTSDSRNLVSEYCLEDLEKWGVNLDDLDQNLGFIVGTDRDNMPEYDKPIMQFNPVNMGAIQKTYEYDWFGNLIEVIENQTNRVLLSPATSDEQNRVYSERLTLASGESATLTGIREAKCAYKGLCGNGFMLMAMDSDFALMSEIRAENDKASLATPRAGQEFTTPEHSSNGTSLGFIQLDSFGFFSDSAPGPIGEIRPLLMEIVDALPGSPLRLTPEGELLISNSDGLDFEVTPTLTFKVQSRLGDDFMSEAIPVTVHLQNINDNAPQLSGTVQTSYQLTAGQELSASLSNWFTDADNDSLTLSLSALPAGLKYNAEQKLLHGTVSQSSTITITATDGDHKTTAELKLTVPEAPAKSSGGSINYVWLVLLVMAGFVRLVQHRTI